MRVYACVRARVLCAIVIVCLCVCLRVYMSTVPPKWIVQQLLNPFTAPVCKISEPKIAQTLLLKVYFWGSITNIISILCVSIKILSHIIAKKKTKKLKDSNFALLLVVLKWHDGSERVNK